MRSLLQLELEDMLAADAKLRDVLRDGEWHHGPELARRVGWRFGGSIERLRKGMDGLPAWFVTREHVHGKIHRYRFEGINPHPPKPGGSWKGRALRAEAKLRALGEEVPSL